MTKFTSFLESFFYKGPSFDLSIWTYIRYSDPIWWFKKITRMASLFFIFCLFIASIMECIIARIQLRLLSIRVRYTTRKPFALIADSFSSTGSYVSRPQDEFDVSEYLNWTESGTWKTNFISNASTEYIGTESDNNLLYGQPSTHTKPDIQHSICCGSYTILESAVHPTVQSSSPDILYVYKF